MRTSRERGQRLAANVDQVEAANIDRLNGFPRDAHLQCSHAHTDFRRVAFSSKHIAAYCSRLALPHSSQGDGRKPLSSQPVTSARTIRQVVAKRDSCKLQG